MYRYWFILLFLISSPSFSESIENYSPPAMFEDQPTNPLDRFTRIIEARDILSAEPRANVRKTLPLPNKKPPLVLDQEMEVPQINKSDVLRQLKKLQ